MNPLIGIIITGFIFALIYNGLKGFYDGITDKEENTGHNGHREPFYWMAMSESDHEHTHEAHEANESDESGMMDF